MSGDDLKQHVNTSHDFYTLLGVEPTSSESEVRRAYRKTALKYHPDKVGANDHAALEKFHLLQIAYDVLSDATVKELYDNARRAREEKKAREAAFHGRRKAMMDELEKREIGAFKRKRDVEEVEERFERELRRLAEDGKRRRKEREEQLRKEALTMEKQDQEDEKPSERRPQQDGVPDIDRSVTLRFRRSNETSHLDRDRLESLFSRFGTIEGVVLRDKRMKPAGAKHKEDYCLAVLVYESVVGAHAAVSDFEDVRSQDLQYQLIENVEWAAGSAPEFVPRSRPPIKTTSTLETSEREGQDGTSRMDEDGLGTRREKGNGAVAPGNRKVPSFSFKASSQKSGPSLDELTMMRLKQAEKRRLEAKIRQDEAAA